MVSNFNRFFDKVMTKLISEFALKVFNKQDWVLNNKEFNGMVQIRI